MTYEQSASRWRTTCVVAVTLLLTCSCRRDVETAREHPTLASAPAMEIAHPDALPFYGDPSFTPTCFPPDSVPRTFHRIRDFTLTDQRGATLTQHDVAGKVYIANFFFTSCPGICPTTMGSMSRLQRAIATYHDVVLVSHSVAPEADSVEALKAYALKMNAVSATWRLATGSRSEIYDLGRRYYFADEDLGDRRSTAGDSTERFLHTEHFFLVDRHRRIRGIYNGMNRSSVDQLIVDVQKLRSESE
jgi:protein SCO1